MAIVCEGDDHQLGSESGSTLVRRRRSHSKTDIRCEAFENYRTSIFQPIGRSTFVYDGRMDLNSDLLYFLATGFSVISILGVFVARYWFGRDDASGEPKPENVDEDMDEKLSTGQFGDIPVVEWKQLKSALQEEYRKRSMDSSNSQDQYNHDDKAPLLSKIDDEDTDEPELKASPKAVRFNDVVEEKRPSFDQTEYSDAESKPTLFGEDLDDILKDRMDEEELAHLPGQLKSVKLRKATEQLEKGLTDEEKEEEARIRSQQLESIFNLMREQQEKFGTSSMEDIEEQLKLYSF